MASNSVTYSCGRCGIKTHGGFCKDCREVDPVMTRGGPTARSLAAARLARQRWEDYVCGDPRPHKNLQVAPRPW